MEQFIFALGIVLFMFYAWGLLKRAESEQRMDEAYQEYQKHKGAGLLYCEELNRTGDEQGWRMYAKSLTKSAPMRRDLDLMTRQQFLWEILADRKSVV